MGANANKQLPDKILYDLKMEEWINNSLSDNNWHLKENH
jgi:hypothetical protein